MKKLFVLALLAMMVGQSAIATNKMTAVLKHRTAISNTGSRPAFTRINGCQVGTVYKHPTHFFHFPCIEMAQVKTRQAGAAKEHTVHIRHVPRIEIVQAKAR